MRTFEKKARRLAALCLLGIVLFNYPVLAIFNVAANAFGIPVLYAYVFTAWSLMVAAMAFVVES